MICYCFSPVKGHSSWPRFGLLGVFSSSSLSRARSAPLFLSARAHQPRRPNEADVVPSASSDARWLVDFHMQFNTAVRVINNHVGVVLYPWPRVITSGALICYRCYQLTSGPWCNACKKCRYMKQTTKYIKLQKKAFPAERSSCQNTDHQTGRPSLPAGRKETTKFWITANAIS